MNKIIKHIYFFALALALLPTTGRAFFLLDNDSGGVIALPPLAAGTPGTTAGTPSTSSEDGMQTQTASFTAVVAFLSVQPPPLTVQREGNFPPIPASLLVAVETKLRHHDRGGVPAMTVQEEELRDEEPEQPSFSTDEEAIDHAVEEITDFNQRQTFLHNHFRAKPAGNEQPAYTIAFYINAAIDYIINKKTNPTNEHFTPAHQTAISAAKREITAILTPPNTDGIAPHVLLDGVEQRLGEQFTKTPAKMTMYLLVKQEMKRRLQQSFHDATKTRQPARRKVAHGRASCTDILCCCAGGCACLCLIGQLFTALNPF